ncbi:MAG: type II toxin-antitoxin system RelB/DinJ family antitoxin [Candidatus Shapirobacteria bacterium]|jgi:addiction module RelB/DinJ family antitoxin
MNTSVINIKTDLNIKRQAAYLAEELGLSLSSLINVLLKQFIRNKSLHLSLEPDETKPSQWFSNNLAKSVSDLEAGQTSPAFTKSKDALKWLKSDQD